MNPSPSHPADKKGGHEGNGREHFVEGTVIRPKSFVLLFGFASVVVAVFQTVQWLLDVWHLFSL